MDTATIVSIQPFAVKENRPGLYPGDFFIPPASPDEPRFLVVSNGQIRMMDQDFRPFLMEEDRLKIAQDIADGHCQSLIGFSPTTRPGVFALPGVVLDKETLLRNFKKVFDERVEQQVGYFKVLIAMADDDWRRNKQLRHISDIQRAAAVFLSLDREWLLDDIDSTMKCPSCMSTISRLAVVCFACRLILDAKRYDGMRFHDDSQNSSRVGGVQSPVGEELKQDEPDERGSKQAASSGKVLQK